MTTFYKNNKPVLWLVIVAFLVNTLFAQQPVQADVPFLPVPGRMVELTPAFTPPLIHGLKIFRNNPFKFEFVMSQGDDAGKGDDYSARQVFLKEEADKLVKYFLASLTIPDQDMWVNLSPYERNHIVPRELGITEMGKELLVQDYLLKQVTASVMYPEGSIGKRFWHKIYQEAYKRFGTTNIPVNTYNKVWIVPGTAEVYENALDNTAVILDSKLKVMLEDDYLALRKSGKIRGARPSQTTQDLGKEIIRQIIIPELTKEVNEGRNFAELRQVYQSLILAIWYKSKLKQSLISQGYVDRRKINGVDVEDKDVDQKIYRQYLKSYKKGVYNYIKEDITPDNEVVPRKYFSGGFSFQNAAMTTRFISGPDAAQAAARALRWGMFAVTVGIAATFLPGAASAQNTQHTTTAVAPASVQSPIAPIKINPNDSVSKIVVDEINRIQASLPLSQRSSYHDFVKAGLISILGADGKPIEHPNFNIVQPGQYVSINLTSFVKPQAAASAGVGSSPVTATPEYFRGSLARHLVEEGNTIVAQAKSLEPGISAGTIESVRQHIIAEGNTIVALASLAPAPVASSSSEGFTGSIASHLVEEGNTIVAQAKSLEPGISAGTIESVRQHIIAEGNTIVALASLAPAPVASSSSEGFTGSIASHLVEEGNTIVAQAKSLEPGLSAGEIGSVRRHIIAEGNTIVALASAAPAPVSVAVPSSPAYFTGSLASHLVEEGNTIVAQAKNLEPGISAETIESVRQHILAEGNTIVALVSAAPTPVASPSSEGFTGSIASHLLAEGNANVQIAGVVSASVAGAASSLAPGLSAGALASATRHVNSESKSLVEGEPILILASSVAPAAPPVPASAVPRPASTPQASSSVVSPDSVNNTPMPFNTITVVVQGSDPISIYNVYYSNEVLQQLGLIQQAINRPSLDSMLQSGSISVFHDNAPRARILHQQNNTVFPGDKVVFDVKKANKANELVVPSPNNQRSPGAAPQAPGIQPSGHPGPQQSLGDAFNNTFPSSMPDLLPQTEEASGGGTIMGINVDTNFTQADIPKLQALGVNTVRFFYPPPQELLQAIVNGSSVRNFIITLPFNYASYGAPNVVTYYGTNVPGSNEAVSYESHNYIPYLNNVRGSLPENIKFIVTPFNEPDQPSAYPAWTNKPDNETTYKDLFSLEDSIAQEIHQNVQGNVLVYTNILDKPSHFGLVVGGMPHIDGISLNYYRNNTSVGRQLNAVFRQLGRPMKVIISEFGSDSLDRGNLRGDDLQAGLLALDLKSMKDQMGVGFVAFSLDDDSLKPGAEKERHFGIWDKKAQQVLTDFIEGGWERVASSGLSIDLNTLKFLTSQRAKADNWLKFDTLLDRDDAPYIYFVTTDFKITRKFSSWQGDGSGYDMYAFMDFVNHQGVDNKTGRPNILFETRQLPDDPDYVPDLKDFDRWEKIKTANKINAWEIGKKDVAHRVTWYDADGKRNQAFVFASKKAAEETQNTVFHGVLDTVINERLLPILGDPNYDEQVKMVKQLFGIDLPPNDGNFSRSRLVACSTRGEELVARLVQAGVIDEVSDTVLHVKPGLDDKQEDVLKIVKNFFPDDKDGTHFQEIWDLLQEGAGVGDLIVGAWVVRDNYGLITAVEGFIHARDLGKTVGTVPGDEISGAEEVLTVLKDGQPQMLKVWGLRSDQIPVMTFGTYTPEELDDLKDPQMAKAIFRTYLPKYGRPETRGNVIIGNNLNLQRLINNYQAQKLAEFDRIAVAQYGKYLHQKAILGGITYLAGVGMSFTHLAIPIDGIANFFFDMVWKPYEIGKYMPDRDSLREVYAKLVLLHELDPANSYLQNKNMDEAYYRVEDEWKKLTVEQKKERMVAAYGTIQGLFTENNLVEMQAYLEKIQSTKVGAFIKGQVSVAAAAFANSSLYPQRVVTNGTNNGQQVRFNAPKIQALYAVLAGEYINPFTLQVNVANTLGLLFRGQGFSYVSLGQMLGHNGPKVNYVANAPHVSMPRIGFLDYLFSFFGIELNGEGFVNEMAGPDKFGEYPYPLAPKIGQIYVNFPGGSTSGLIEQELTKNIFRITGDGTISTDELAKICAGGETPENQGHILNALIEKGVISRIPSVLGELRVSEDVQDKRALVESIAGSQADEIMNLLIQAGDGKAFMYLRKDGRFWSHAASFDRDENYSLNRIVEAVPIATIGRIGIDGKPLEVPVYAISFLMPDGHIENTIGVMTRSALRLMQRNIENDIKRVNDYAKAIDEGGYIITYGPKGGTLEQNLFSGFFVSHSQQGTDSFPSAFTSDQGDSDIYLIDSGNSNNRASAYHNLMRYRLIYSSIIKADRKGRFVGFTKSYNAFTGQPMDNLDVMGTAIIAEAVMEWEKTTGDTTSFRPMLEGIIDWLLEVQEGAKTVALPDTPGPDVKKRYSYTNAVVSKVLYNYGTHYQGSRASGASEVSEKISQWAPQLWNKDLLLIRNEANEDVYSADSQMAWFMKDPMRFVQTFLGGRIEDVPRFFQGVEDHFGVRVPNWHNAGKMVDLLDLSDYDHARRDRLPVANNPANLRIGFPKVTEDYTEALKLALQIVTDPDGRQKLEALLHKYSTSLADLANQDGNQPAATAPNEYDGFNPGRTPLGDISLDPSVRYRLETVMGKSVLDLDSPMLGNAEGLTVPDVKKPQYQLSYEFLNEGVQVVYGKANYDRMLQYVGKTIDADEIAHNQLVTSYDPYNYNLLNARFDDQYGTVGMTYHLVLIPPSEDRTNVLADFSRQRVEQRAIRKITDGTPGAVAASHFAITQKLPNGDKKVWVTRDTKDWQTAPTGKIKPMPAKSDQAMISNPISRRTTFKLGIGAWVAYVAGTGKRASAQTPATPRLLTPNDNLFDIISKLPVTVQNFIAFKHFQDFEIPGIVGKYSIGTAQRGFVHVTDPYGVITSKYVDGGFIRFLVTNQQVTFFNYDEKTGLETASFTYDNPYGDREDMVNTLLDPRLKSLQDRVFLFKDRKLIEETTTIDVTMPTFIHSSSFDPKFINPYNEILTKRNINYNTGRTSVQIYGLFDQPVKELDGFFVTENKFNEFGRFVSSKVYNNGQENYLPSEKDFPSLSQEEYTLAGKDVQTSIDVLVIRGISIPAGAGLDYINENVLTDTHLPEKFQDIDLTKDVTLSPYERKRIGDILNAMKDPGKFRFKRPDGGYSSFVTTQEMMAINRMLIEHAHPEFPKARYDYMKHLSKEADYKTLRYTNRVDVPEDNNDLVGLNKLIPVISTNEVTGAVRELKLDAETGLTRFSLTRDANGVVQETELEYDHRFRGGKIPVRTTTRGLVSRAVVKQTESQAYNPDYRQLTVTEVDNTSGKPVTTAKVYDPRWENYIQRGYQDGPRAKIISVIAYDRTEENGKVVTTRRFDNRAPMIISSDNIRFVPGQYDVKFAKGKYVVTTDKYSEGVADQGHAFERTVSYISPVNGLMLNREAFNPLFPNAGRLRDFIPAYDSDGLETEGSREFAFSPKYDRRHNHYDGTVVFGRMISPNKSQYYFRGNVSSQTFYTVNGQVLTPSNGADVVGKFVSSSATVQLTDLPNDESFYADRPLTYVEERNDQGYFLRAYYVSEAEDRVVASVYKSTLEPDQWELVFTKARPDNLIYEVSPNGRIGVTLARTYRLKMLTGIPDPLNRVAIESMLFQRRDFVTNALQREFGLNAFGEVNLNLYYNPEEIRDNQRFLKKEEHYNVRGKAIVGTDDQPQRAIFHYDDQYRMVGINKQPVQGPGVNADTMIGKAVINGEVVDIPASIQAQLPAGINLVSREEDYIKKDTRFFVLNTQDNRPVIQLNTLPSDREHSFVAQVIYNPFTTRSQNTSIDRGLYRAYFHDNHLTIDPDQNVITTLNLKRKLSMDDVMNDSLITTGVGRIGDTDNNHAREARKLFEKTVKDIARQLGTDDYTKFTYNISTDSITNDGRRFFVRIDQDPQSRIILYISSDEEPDLTVNMTFSGSDPLSAYEISADGQIYALEADNPELVKDFLHDYEIPESWKEGELKGTMVYNHNLLMPVSEYLLRNPQFDDNGNLTDQRKFKVLTRLLGNNDPLNRDTIKIDRSTLRFPRYDESPKSEVTLTTPRGETASAKVYGKDQKIVRKTEYVTKLGDEYVYKVTYEYKGGYDFTEKNHIYIGFNYKTGRTWEHYVDDRDKIYSSGSFPIATVRVPAQFKEFDDWIHGRGPQPQEYLYSRYKFKTLNAPEGNYVKIYEDIRTKTPDEKPQSRIIRDNELVLLIADTQNPHYAVDVFQMSFEDQFRNSPVGVLIPLLRGPNLNNLARMDTEINRDGEDLFFRTPFPDLPLWSDPVKSYYRMDVLDRVPFIAHHSTLNNALTIATYGLGAVGAYFSVFHVGASRVWKNVKERLASTTNANGSDMAMLSKIVGKDIARKYVIIRQINGPFIIGANVKNLSDKREYLRSYLTGFGVTDQEFDTIWKAVEQKKLSFDGTDDDPRDAMEAVAMPENLDENDLRQLIDQQAQRGYPQAMVLQEILSKNLLRGISLEALMEHIPSSYRGQMRWTQMMRLALIASENNYLSTLARSNDLTIPLLHELVVTPEVRLIKTLLDNNYITPESLQQLARNYLGQEGSLQSFKEFAINLLTDQVINPAINDVYNNTFRYAGPNGIGPKRLQEVSESIISEVHRFLMLDPTRITAKNPGEKSEIVFNPFPMASLFEPNNIRQFVLFKFIQMAPSDTNDHSLGALSLLYPLTMFVAKDAMHMMDVESNLPQAQRAADVLERIRLHAEFWRNWFVVNLWADGKPGLFKILTEPDEDKGVMQPTEFNMDDLLLDTDLYILMTFLNSQEGDKGYKLFGALAKTILDMDPMKNQERMNNNTVVADLVKNVLEGNAGKEITNQEFNDLNRQTSELARKFRAFVNRKDHEKNNQTQNNKDFINFVQGQILPRTDVFKEAMRVFLNGVSKKAVQAGKLTRKWRGLSHLWGERIIKPVLFRQKTFWSIPPGWRNWLSYGLLAAGLGGSYWIFTSGGNWAAAGIFTTVLTIGWARMLTGKVQYPSSRLFFMAVYGFVALYHFGLLFYHLYGNLNAIHYDSFGFLLTALQYNLMAPLTMLSTFQAAVAIRSHYRLGKSTWSKAWINWFGLPSLIRFWPGNLVRLYKNTIIEGIDLETRFAPVTPTGEPTQVFLTRIIRRSIYFRQDEKNAWINLINDPQNAPLPKLPEWDKGREFLYQTFFAFVQKKPQADNFAYLQATSSHVQSSSEPVRYLSEVRAPLGSFDTIKVGNEMRDTSLLGHLISYHRNNGFNYVLDNLRSNNLGDVADKLEKMGPLDDVGPILQGLSNDQLFKVTEALDNFMNEILPNNGGVIEALGRVIAERHIYTALQLGDYSYANAAEDMLERYGALKNAEMQLNLEQHQRELTDEERWFLEKYDTYEGLVLLKYRAIFHEDTLWRGHISRVGDGYDFYSSTSLFANWHQDALNQLPPDDRNALVESQRELQDIFHFNRYAHNLTDFSDSVLESRKEHIQQLLDIFNDPKIKSALTRADKLSKGVFSKSEILQIGPRGKSILSRLIQKGVLEEYSDTEVRLNLDLFKQDVGRSVALVESIARDDSDKVLPVLQKAFTIVNNSDLKKELERIAAFINNYENFMQIIYIIDKTNRAGVYLPFYKEGEKDNPIARNKNGSIGANLWIGNAKSLNLDAWVRPYPGQEAYNITVSTVMGRNPDIMVVNPTMRIWNSSNDGFPVTAHYAIAQHTWTSDTQRGIDNWGSFYGKGWGVPYAIDTIVSQTGEDSAAYLMLKVIYPNIVSIHIDYNIVEWGRMTNIDTVYTTEQRYGENVTNFEMYPTTFAHKLNPQIGYDIKLGNTFLFMHYISVIFGILLIATLPFGSMFSSFAKLTPAIVWIGLSYFFLIAVNYSTYVRHLRESGSVWAAVYRTVRDIYRAQPMFVSILAMIDLGVRKATHSNFKFARTDKRMTISGASEAEKHKLLKLLQFPVHTSVTAGVVTAALGLSAGFLSILFWSHLATGFGWFGVALGFVLLVMGAYNAKRDKSRFPYYGMVGTFALLSWIGTLFVSLPIGPLVYLPYLMAGVVTLTGHMAYTPYYDAKSKQVKGASFMRIFGSATGMWVFSTLLSLRIANSYWGFVNDEIVLSVWGIAIFLSGGWFAKNVLREKIRFLTDAFAFFTDFRGYVKPSNLPPSKPSSSTPSSPNPRIPPSFGPANSAGQGPVQNPTANPAMRAEIVNAIQDTFASPFTNRILPVNRLRDLGGIDLSNTQVAVHSSGDLIQMSFNDPAMLRLLLNSDGLAPIIIDVKEMTPSMVNHFVGLN